MRRNDLDDNSLDASYERELEGPVTRAVGHKRPRAWEVKADRETRRELELEVMMKQMQASIGGILSAITAAPMDDILATTSGQVDVTGYSSFSWPIPYATISIANTSAHTLVITSNGPSPDGKAPGRSTGAIWIPSGLFRVIGLRSSVLTIYGTAGDHFDFTAYTRPQAPSVGQCGTV